MNRPWLIAGGALVVVVLAAAVVYTSQQRVEGAGATRAAPPAVTSAAPPATATATPVPGASAAPWMNATPPPAVVGAAAAQQREIESMQAELGASLRAGVTPDPRKVDATLAKIEAVHGSSVVSGINIDAVRANLAIAAKLQVLAADMDAESKKGSRMDNDRLRLLVGQVQQLQAQMRTDIGAPATGTPPAVAR